MACKTFKYALTFVDVTSRYEEADPLATQEAKEVASALEKIYKRSLLEWPNQLQVDPGLEVMVVTGLELWIVCLNRVNVGQSTGIVDYTTSVCRRLGETYPQEDDLKNDYPLLDINDTVHAANSKVVMLNSTQVFEVGDSIVFNVIVRDGNRNRRKKGGDIIRLWLESEHTELTSMIGTVVDNRNGTYTAAVKLFIPGVFHVKAMVTYSRESVRARYRSHRLGSGPYYFRGTFKHGSVSTTTYCDPLSSALSGNPVCNITSRNYGMPFFCGRPTESNLSCEHWSGSKTLVYTNPTLPLTEMERTLLDRAHTWQYIPTAIVVVVKEGESRPDELPDCQSLDKQRLWEQRSPVGFFKNGSYFNVMCGVDHDINRYRQCMKGRRLYFFGDSLSRQMYVTYNRIMCGANLHWPPQDLHKPKKYINSAHNLTSSWVVHSMPFHSAIEITKFNKGISELLEDIGPHEDAVVVISHHTHLLVYHHSVFEERMEIYRRVIKAFFSRNSRAVIFIKGMGTWEGNMQRDSCFVELYNNIMRCALSGISQRLIFLDHNDIGVLSKNRDLHPGEFVVREYVLNMLGFIC
ncbi:hypothetical protein ScPMuIL_011419 [Solemya velum]